MESIVRVLRELSELIRTRFREMAIIVLCFAFWKLAINYKELDTSYKELDKEYRQSEKDNSDQIISIFMNSYRRNFDIVEKAMIVKRLSDSLNTSKNGK